MKIIGVLLCSFLSTGVVLAQESVTVKNDGETIVSSKAENTAVEIRLRTNIVQIGSSSSARPSKSDSNCTYSRFPCSVLKGMDIVVDGFALFVPRSAYCDLADLTRAELSNHVDRFTMRLYGGGASEGYIAEIEFTKTEVIRRTLSSSVSPNEPLQETKYYVRVLGD